MIFGSLLIVDFLNTFFNKVSQSGLNLQLEKAEAANIKNTHRLCIIMYYA